MNWKNVIRQIKIEIFLIYSWIWNVLLFLMELFPPIIRKLVWKIGLKKLGRYSNIDYRCYCRYPSKISIGSNTMINRGTQLFASAHSNEDVDIEIGNNVRIGPNVRMYSAGHDTSDLDFRHTYGKIVVGDNTWVGGNSVILQGVTIGEGAVVAAGSVVVKDVEPYKIVGGCRLNC